MKRRQSGKSTSRTERNPGGVSVPPAVAVAAATRRPVSARGGSETRLRGSLHAGSGPLKSSRQRRCAVGLWARKTPSKGSRFLRANILCGERFSPRNRNYTRSNLISESVCFFYSNKKGLFMIAFVLRLCRNKIKNACINKYGVLWGLNFCFSAFRSLPVGTGCRFVLSSVNFLRINVLSWMRSALNC